MENHLPWYKNLRYERERRALSQEEVAAAIGIDARIVRAWESGQNFPRPKHRRALCELYGKHPEELGLVKENTIRNSGESHISSNQGSHLIPGATPQDPSLPLTVVDPPLNSGPQPAVVTTPSPGTHSSRHHISRRMVLTGLVGLTVAGVVSGSLSWLTFFHRFSFPSFSSPPSPLPLGTGQPKAEKWKSTGDMLLSRHSFRATPLKTGMVLIEGGYTSHGLDTAESELFDPLTGVWIKTRGMLNEGRREHTATLLPNGKVLITGGYADEGRHSAELYDPAMGEWTLTRQKMIRPRSRHTATLLLSGEVLIVGGVEGLPVGGQPLATAELYDPTTDTWSSAGRMATPRADHVAVLMSDGKVVVAGGTQQNDGHTKTNKAEIYDPSTNSWSPTQEMNVARAYFTAVPLSTRQVLAIGGRAEGYNSTVTAEVYDPTAGSWSMTGDMRHNRENSLGQDAVVLDDGTVLVVGGDSSGTSEIYSPAIGTWTTALKMNSVRSNSVTALLEEGRVLVAGGFDCLCNNPHILTSAEIYTPT